MAETERKIAWYSWLILAGHLAWNAVIVLITSGDVVNSTLRWGVTIVFFAVTLAFGAYDFFIAKEKATRDETPFDKWTIVHTFAGLALGVWYVPLIYMLISIIWWEIFELTVKGYGHKEVIINRGVDIGVAVAGWLVVVGLAMWIAEADFPVVNPVSG